MQIEHMSREVDVRSNGSPGSGKIAYRVLGPFERRSSGTATNLGGPKQRAVLAMLVTRVGEAVPAEVLITGVWGDDAAPSLKGSLHTYISNLRVALGDGIVRVGNGYQLEAPASSVDARVFEQLVDQARNSLSANPSQAADLLREALAMWRGLPYADLHDVPGLQTEIRRLEDLRLVGVESRLDADLAMGRHRAVIGELEALATEYPLREGFRVRHMLALYRDGRQADALRAYQRTRGYLAEELGVDPTPELQRLEERILAHDPTLLASSDVRTEEVAFLFTDVEGSTVLWETRPEEMRNALAVHDSILTEAITEAGGRVFKHTGDGMLAAFPAVTGAAEAAARIQSKVAEHDWGPVEPLKIRMSVDVGEVEARGGDYFGVCLSRAARLMGAAHGGQVVLSSAASDQLRHVPGMQIRSLGEYRFKGLGAPQQVFQLSVPGLDGEFPDLSVDGFVSDGSRQFGDAIRGYELRERVGLGRFGVVYRAYQPSVGREVAVKVIRTEYANHPVFVRRFESEARLVAKLAHPHIVPLFDFWRDPEGAYLVMPYLAGRSLGGSRYGALPLERVVEIIRQIGSALAYAHRQGVIHRDVKPANVLLDDDGNAYVADFGVSVRAVEQATGVASSSQAYRAPEDHDGAAVDERTDVYSLAAVTVELLTGGPPTDIDLSVLPAGVRKVLQRGLDLEPQHRHHSIDEFVAELVASAGGTDVDVRPTVVRNPYKGLAAFDESDARDFFGRTEEIEELCDLVTRHRFVTVVGPSGSGKSSLVRAGLVPALDSGRIHGSSDWLTVTMVPGAHPFDELATALSAVAGESLGELAAELRSDRHGLLRVGKRLSQDLDSDLLLVVDQFEELYSLVTDPKVRDAFVESLIEAAEDPHGRLRIVATIRADFFDHPLSFDSLGRMVAEAHLALAVPGPDQLLEAIEGPAAAAGLHLEAGLSHRIAGDVRDQPGALPLMEFVLTDLAHHTDDGRMTWRRYDDAGSVAGALSRRADDVLVSLDDADREVAEQVFLRLVTVSDEADDVRRRVRRSELESLGFDACAVGRVLDAFGLARLLTFDRDPITRGPTVEVAHEALLREWDRLRDWVEQRREALVLRRRFVIAMGEWEASGRSEGHLPSEGRLAQFEELGADPSIQLAVTEKAFLDAALAERDSRRADRRRRRRAILAGFATATLVSSSLALVAWRSATRSSARELLAQAELSLPFDPQLSLALGLEAHDRFDRVGDPPSEVFDVLREGISRNRVKATLPQGGSIGVSHDGSVIVTADAEADATVWEAATLSRLYTLDPGDGSVIDWIVGSSVGEMFFEVRHLDGSSEIRAWPVGSPELGDVIGSSELTAAAGPDGVLGRNLWVDVSDGGGLVAEGINARLKVRRRGAELPFFEDDLAESSEFAFGANGDLAYIAERDVPTLMIVDSSGRETWSREISISNPVFVMASPDGARAAVASQTEVAVYDANGEVWVRSDLGRAFRPGWLDEDRLVVGGEGLLSVLDGSTGDTILSLPGHQGGSFSYHAIPDSGLVISAGRVDGTSVIHDVSSLVPGAVASSRFELAGLPRSRMWVDSAGNAIVKDAEGAVYVDPFSGTDLRYFEGGVLSTGTWGFPTVSGNARFLAALDGDRFGLWSLDEDREVYRAPEGWSVRGVADDGSIAVINREAETRVIDLSSFTTLKELDAGATIGYVDFTVDGSLFMTMAQDNGDDPFFKVWDAASFDEVASFGVPSRWGFLAGISPDGRWVVVGGEGGDIFIYDFHKILEGASDDDALVSTIADAHDNFIIGLSISADSRLVVSSAWDEPARLWDLESGRRLGEFGEAHPSVAFHPTEPWLYVAEGNMLTIHRIGDDLVTAAREAARPFTNTECELYFHRSCDG